MGSAQVSARYTSTAAVTCSRSPPAAVRPPIRTSSTTPAPPGVTGIAVASRAKANTTSTWAQETSASLTPTARRQASSTTYSDR